MNDNLKLAIHNNDYENINILLLEETDLSSNASDALAFAASLGNTNLVTMIASYLSDSSHLDRAMWQAAIHTHFETMEALLSLGADVNSRQANSSLLFWATSTKNLRLIKFLLDKGADVNSRNFTIKWTPIMWAASEGQVEIVRLYLRFGADVNATDQNGVSIIRLAMLRGYKDVADTLKDWAAVA